MLYYTVNLLTSGDTFKSPLFEVSLHRHSFLMMQGDFTFRFVVLILVWVYLLDLSTIIFARFSLVNTNIYKKNQYSIPEVIINRDSWGYSCCAVRGEIIELAQDKLLRKHLPRMFSLIKNKSWGVEYDQIPLQSHP